MIRLQVIDSPQTLNICDLYQNIPYHVPIKNAILSADNCRVAYLPVTAFTPDHSFRAPSNTCKPVPQTTNRKVDGPTSLYGIAKQATKHNITIQCEPSLTMILIIFSGLQHHLKQKCQNMVIPFLFLSIILKMTLFFFNHLTASLTDVGIARIFYWEGPRIGGHETAADVWPNLL